MKNPVMAVSIFIALLITIIAAGYPLSSHGEGLVRVKETTQGFRIKTSRPSKRDFRLTINFYGSVLSQHKVALRAPVSGRIMEVRTVDEKEVKKGDILFVMGGPEVERKIQALNSQASHLRGLLSELRGVLERKKSALQKKLISIDELEAVKLQLIKTENAYNETLLRLHQLEDSLKVRASLEGRFTRRKVVEGQDVDRGEIIGHIIDTRHLRVVGTAFPPHEYTEIKGKKAVIYTGDGLSVHGTVKKLLTERTTSGGVRVWIESEDIDRALRVGESVRGIIILRTDRKVLSVPERAVVYDEHGRPFVFIKTKDNQYVRRPIRAGLLSDGWVEVISGISEADEVVSEGAYELFYRDFNRTFRVAD